MVFGVGLLHALITAPQGIAGQLQEAPLRFAGGSSAAAGAIRMIEIDDLTVLFGGVRGLNALTASLPEPVTGLVGPNGAGKTTLINVLSGFVRPASGSVKIDGEDLDGIALHKRAAFGITPHVPE